MLKMIKYLKPYTGCILLIFLLVFVQTMTDLALPDYMSRIVDTGIVNGDTDFILVTGLEMLGVALAGALCTVLVGLLAARVAAGFSRTMREKVFTQVENFSLAEFDQFSTASLITRTTNDIQQVQMFIIMMLRIVVSAPIMGIGGILKAVGKSSSMSWIIALSVALLLTLIFILYSVAMPKFKLMQKLVDRLNLVTRETLSGILVVRAFNTQQRELKKFDDANRNLTKTNLFVNRAMSFMNPMMNLVLNMTTIAIIWIGAHQIDLGTLQVGNMMAFIQYAMQIIMSFLMVSMVFIILPRASVSAERIREVLDTRPAVRDPMQPEAMGGARQDAVVFQDVTFAYPGADEPVLSHISFTAKRGQTTAFIGSTGSGKSTLVNLIPRFYDVTEGAILVDGVDIRNVSQKALREKIGYVPQKGVLFSGTVDSNIRYGRETASQDQVWDAVVTAQAADFIEEKENGLHSEISQGGTNVSGGQKQRISIARALVRQPEIYIFDDSFSALDFKTDAQLRKALAAQTRESAVLIVAQRISTILHADQIIVLDDGEMVGKGTHRELLESCDVYREIALSQLSKEELA